MSQDAPDRSTDPGSTENDPRDVNRLPPLGEGTKRDNWNLVNNFLNLLANKAVNFYTDPCDRADTNLRVLETGKSTKVEERDVIANKIRQDMLTMLATLLRDACSRKVVAESKNEPPQMVQYLDRQTMSFQQFPVDDQAEADFEQRVIDWHWDNAELDADIWMVLLNARTAGWYTAPFEWDWQKMLPRIRSNISVRQVLLDPAAGPIKAVETANWAFLRWRVNWWQARALFPHMASDISRLAADGPELSDPFLQLGRNEQTQTTGEVMIDLSFFWIRDYPVQPMQPAEALAYGLIETRPNTPGNAGADGGQSIQSTAASADTGLAPDQGGNPPVASDAGVPPTGEHPTPDSQPGIIESVATQPQDLTPQFFLPQGDKPITPTDPEWPWWLGIRQIGRVQQCIADDRLCPYYDIPLLHMPANPLPLSACGQGDPDAMQKIQEGHNRALTNAVEHSDLMAHPVKVFAAGAWAQLPQKYKEEGASIAGMSVIINDELFKALGGKISITEQAEPISAALGSIIQILGTERQDITPAPSALQGNQTGDVTGWQATQLLQQSAISKFDLPAMFLQMMVKRAMKFVRHAVLFYVPIEKLQQICSDIPPEVVAVLVQRGQQNDRNVEVVVNLASGGAQDRRKAEAVQQFGLVDEVPNSPTFGQRVIGMETLREAMNVDNRKETQRQQPPPPQPQQQDKPSEQISFKDLPTAGKIQMAGQAGIQLSPQDLAQKQADDNAAKQAQAAAKPQPQGAPQ